MSKKQVRQMIEELTAKLCAREFLAASNLSRESVLMLMNREYWEGQLGRIFPIKRRIQCREIYEQGTDEPDWPGAQGRVDEIRLPVRMPYPVSGRRIFQTGGALRRRSAVLSGCSPVYL